MGTRKWRQESFCRAFSAPASLDSDETIPDTISIVNKARDFEPFDKERIRLLDGLFQQCPDWNQFGCQLSGHRMPLLQQAGSIVGEPNFAVSVLPR